MEVVEPDQILSTATKNAASNDSPNPDQGSSSPSPSLSKPSNTASAFHSKLHSLAKASPSATKSIVRQPDSFVIPLSELRSAQDQGELFIFKKKNLY